MTTRAKRPAPLPPNVIPIRPPPPTDGWEFCMKPGPCPCADPCAWGIQPGQFVPVFRELTQQWAANQAPRRSAAILPFSPRGEGEA